MAYKRLEWFCGANAESVSQIFWKNICLINFTYAIAHTTFALLFFFAVVTTYCKTRSQAYLLVKSSGHNLRWIFSIFLLLIQLLAICEGIFTDRSKGSNDILPYLFVPSVCAFVASFLAVITSHCVELWRRQWPSSILVIYWILSCVYEIIRITNSVHLGLNDYQIVRFDIEIILLVTYGILCFIQAYSIGKTVMSTETALTTDNDNSNLFVRESTSFPSMVFLHWVHRLLNLGNRKALTIVDLGCLPAEHLVALNHRRFDQTMQDELENSSKSGDIPSLFRILWKNSWKVLTASTFLRCISDPIALITPFLIGRIIVFMTEMGTPPRHVIVNGTDVEDYTTIQTFHFISLRDLSYNGFVLLMAIFVVNVLERLFYWTSDYLLAIESLHVKVAVQAAVYQRSLQLSSMMRYDDWYYSYQDSSQKLTNYMSHDADRIMLAVQKINSIFPIFMTLAVLGLLYITMGFSALWGFLAVVVLFPIFSIIGGCVSGCQERAKLHTENRMKHTYELLREIKLLKLNAWEQLFCDGIEKFRLKEVCELCTRNLVYAFSVFGSASTPLIMMAVSYGTYTTLAGKPLTAEVAFVSLALFNLLDRYLFDIPLTLSSLVSGYASVKKLERFILFSSDSDEPKRGKYEIGLEALKSKGTAAKEKKGSGNVMVKFSFCNIAWNKIGTFCEPVLKNIDVEIETGKLTVVVGPVGSGKSAFLASMLGEMTMISGSIKFPSGEPTLALSSQMPWIENTTLQDNILCGLPMKRQRYSAVISACELEPDMEILPYGDLTELGGLGGIVLSSGQKQIINLARAIYSSARLVILDDPLSDLDDQVGEKVFENGIIGLLKGNNRTVVLVTNQLQYIRRADKVIILDQGEIYYQGPQESVADVVDPSLLHRDQKSIGSAAERVALRRQVRQHQQYGEAAEARSKTKRAKFDLGERSSLVSKDDEREHMSLTFAVYLFLLNAGGLSLFVSIIGFGGVQAFLLVRDFWLTTWTGHVQKDSGMHHTAYFIEGYIGFSVGGICAIVGSNLMLAIAAYMTGVDLHKRMLYNIIKSPFRFFDTNPVGEIMEKFSKDIDVTDTALFRYFEGSIHHGWCIILGFVAITVVVPYFAIVAVVTLIAYLSIQQYYLKTSRELQNFDNSLSSPILSHFVETLDGRSTIKAYRNQQRMFSRLMRKIDTRSTVYVYLKSVNTWMNIRFDLIGAFIVLLAGYGAICYGLAYSLNPALIAFAIVYAQKISTQFAKLVGFISNLGTQMESIARIKEYATSPTETYEGISIPPNDWPMRGSIRFENLYIKYDEELDSVLERIYLNIHAGEKIGICGRPGSGKTSLIMSLARSNVVFRGRIYIDGFNIAGIPLTTLRRHLSIIPYQPTLIRDTVRNNLDPEGNISDEELWDALALAEMKPIISLMNGGLDAVLTEGGSNLSSGQRQLFCLARAFLRKSRILIMDDISPSVDNDTVEKIQEVLKNSFANRTVIMVASDVKRILDSDKVIVMGDGNVKEFDTPKNLLAKPGSMFSAMKIASEVHTV